MTGKYLYWGKHNEPGIWRMSVEGGEETRIIHNGVCGLFAVAEPGDLVPGRGCRRRDYVAELR
jgi:hypothetical protein